MSVAAEPVLPLRQIAVIGAGLAGRSFTRRLLACGFHVTLEDVLPSNLRQATAEMDDAERALREGTLCLVNTVEDAVRSADLAIDFVPDELESKLEILSMMDRMAPPRTILLTPTDDLSISDLASCTYRPDRCLGLSGLSPGREWEGSPVVLMHPPSARPEVLEATTSLLAALGLVCRTMTDTRTSHLTGR